MGFPVHLIYYGDQSVEPYDSILDLVTEAPASSVLSQLLRSAFKTLQGEAANLAIVDRSLFYGRDFPSLIDHIKSKQVRNPAIATALTSVAQLGWTILHRERKPELWSERSERIVFGVCTGTLAAIAATAALSDTDLIRLTPHTVRLAFRLGCKVSQWSVSVERSQESWSIAVSRISTETIEAELQRFNDNQRAFQHRQVVISARAPSSTTLSGPPSALAKFLSLEPMRHAQTLALPIYGLFHAPNLPLLDVEELIDDSDLFSRPVEAYKALLHPRMSSSARSPSLKEVLAYATTEIVQLPLDLNIDIKEICKRARNHNIELISIGPSRTSYLERALDLTQVHRFGSRMLRFPHALENQSEHEESIAVVGMSGRFPDAQSVDELWDIFIQGRDVHKLIPIDRFDIRTHVDSTGNVRNTSLTPYGCFDDHAGDFDISLFKMSPREAAQTDPMHRMMMLTAYEALESAGYYDTGDLENRPLASTFYGVGTNDYQQANSGQDIDTNYITGGTRAFGPGRLSYYLGWEGPSMIIDAACSASGVAIHQAICSLRLRECDLALAGGANLLTSSDMFAGLSRARFVNKTGPCKTLDETGDGYCRSDSTATVVLKRYGDALKEKDNILGVIRSIKTYHAGTAISLTHPDVRTQSLLFDSALITAGVGIDDIDHVEMHGTGTQSGDLCEVTSILGLLKEPRPAGRPLTISSIKPNVGHSESASGVTSLIKGLLMFQYQTIPQHIGIRTRYNPKLPPLEHFNVVVPTSNLPYPVSNVERKRRLLLNNFNATGGITAMVLEEHRPPVGTETVDIRGYYPVILSAATPRALSGRITRLLEFLRTNLNVSVADLSYTSTARRLHHNYRFGCVAASIQELIEQLAQSDLARQPSLRRITPCNILVFSGQASFYTGVGKTLFETNSYFRSQIQRSEQLCQDMGLPSFIDLIRSEVSPTSTPSSTRYHLATVVVQIALADLFKSWAVQPKAVIGHSLGEYSALYVAEVLGLADVLYLVGQRGLILESKCTPQEYGMAAVALSGSRVMEILQSSGLSECDIACYNAPNQTVVSGPVTDIDQLLRRLQMENIKTTKLQSSYGFHSRQMDEISPEFQAIADSVRYQSPKIPFVSTLLGQIVKSEGSINADYICRHTREPVQFRDSLYALNNLLEPGQRPFFIELGPSMVCSPMIASTLGTKSHDLASALDSKKSNWFTISGCLIKLSNTNGEVRWDEYHKEYLDALRLLQLPSYPFDLRRYWIAHEGDWIIRKNQKAEALSEQAQPPLPTLHSSSLHVLESDRTVNGVRTAAFLSYLDSKELLSIVSGCEIGGEPSCPNSLYVDMSLSAASYLCKTSEPSIESLSMEVSSLGITRDAPQDTGSSIILVTATQYDSDTSTVDIRISSVDGEVSNERARCRIIAGSIEKRNVEANRNAYLYHSRMDILNLFQANGQIVELSQLEIYQRISSIVEYHNAFRGLQQVLLNTGAAEAMAKLIMTSNDGQYICDPRWLEVLLQLPYLVVNCGPAAASGMRLTLDGWEKMHMLLLPEPNVVYRAHVRMQPTGRSGSMIGDLYVFDGTGSVVTLVTKVRFQPQPTTGSSPSASPPSPRSPEIMPVSTSDDDRASSGIAASKIDRVDNLDNANFSTDTSSLASMFSEMRRRPSPVLASSLKSQLSSISTPTGVSRLPSRAAAPSHDSEKLSSNHKLRRSSARSPHPRSLPAPVGISAEEPKTIAAKPIPPNYDSKGEEPTSTFIVQANYTTAPSAATNGIHKEDSFERIRAIIAADVGLEPDDLTDDTMLQEIGVDSIIQLSLTSSLQKHLDRELPADFFLEYNSIGKLRDGCRKILSK